jgi:hypothetical protein
MINNDLLADRLNAFKNNEPIPTVEKNEEYVHREEPLPFLVTLLTQLISLILIFVKSIGYGFAAKTIFSTGWTFWEFLAVGFAFELFLTTILNTFTKNK